MNDPWQRGVKIRWTAGLERRPLAVVDLETVTIASRFAVFSVTLEECAGIWPLGFFELAEPPAA